MIKKMKQVIDWQYQRGDFCLTQQQQINEDFLRDMWQAGALTTEQFHQLSDYNDKIFRTMWGE